MSSVEQQAGRTSRANVCELDNRRVRGGKQHVARSFSAMRQLPLVTYEVCGSALLVLQLLLQNQIAASRTKSTVAANKPPIAAPSPPTPPPTCAPPIVGSIAASANTPSSPRLPAQAHSSRTRLVPRASAPSATPHPFYPNH